jgi:hypothetical protein
LWEPTDIAQEALDSAGLDITVSDIEDGTMAAQLLSRKYRTCLASLLRAAHWRFARSQVQLPILGDVSGVLTPSTKVIQPWYYEYAMPNDCIQAIFVPYNPPTNLPYPQGNIAIPTTPTTTGFPGASVLPGVGLIPARFLIARDNNYPPVQGQMWQEVQGVSPMGQTVILCNVPNAQLVYTSLVLYPSEWDVQFREAMVAYLASEVCFRLHKDKRLGAQVRAQQIAIAKEKINLARVATANEGWNTNDHIAEWTRARWSGGGFPMGGQFGALDGGFGGFWNGWSSIGFSDGGAY